MENLQNDHLSEMDLQLDGEVRQQLYDAGKWARFISIVMFVACGLMLFFGIVGGAAILSALNKLGSTREFFGELNGTVFLVIVVFVIVAVAVVYYFLFNFARKIKNALISENTAELNAGLKSLKIFFIITTVFAILSLLNSIKEMF